MSLRFALVPLNPQVPWDDVKWPRWMLQSAYAVGLYYSEESELRKLNIL